MGVKEDQQKDDSDREDKLELACQCLSRIVQQDVMDDRDVLDLKNIAIWAVTELAHLTHETG